MNGTDEPPRTAPAQPLVVDGYTVVVDPHDGDAALRCTTCRTDVPLYAPPAIGVDFTSMDLGTLLLAAQQHERHRHRFGREAHPAAPTGRAG